MNTYDDIQRFLEKSKMKDIDYKEINESPQSTEMSGSQNQWAVIRQVAQASSTSSAESTASAPLIPQGVSTSELGNNTLGENNPTHQISELRVTPQISTSAPQPSSNFSLLDALRDSFPESASAHQAAAETIASQPSVTSKLPGQTDPLTSRGTNLIDSLNHALSEPITEKPTLATPLPRSEAGAYRAPAVSRSATPDRYRQMFKQKAPQSASQFLHRDTPLQPLLEMIALCR